MKYSKFRKLVSLLVVLMLVSCTSAASSIKQADLVGKWTEEDSKIVIGLPIRSVEFCEDGKVIIAEKADGTYKLLDDDKLEVTLIDGVYEGAIKINRKTLTITKDDGASKSYIKEYAHLI